MSKNILIVDELCYPMLGGQQVHLQSLAEGWVKLGHKVSIVAIDHVGNLPDKEIVNGVLINRLYHDSGYYKGGRFGRKLSTILWYTLKLGSFYKKEYDYVVFNQFPILPVIFYKLFYKKRSKTVLDFVEYRSGAFWKFIQLILFNSTDIVVCISNYVQSMVLTQREKGIFAVPSFIDMGKAKSIRREYILFIGRFEEHKHPDHAIEAVLAYNKVNLKPKELHLIGDGALLKMLMEKYSTENLIIFHGRASDEKKTEILSKSRILILPSEREGLPVVIVEALAYGIPTITTEYKDNGAQYFVKDNGIGLVASPVVSDIANKIQIMENEYELFVEKCNTQKWNYDSKYCCEKYYSILEGIV